MKCKIQNLLIIQVLVPILYGVARSGHMGGITGAPDPILPWQDQLGTEMVHALSSPALKKIY